MRKKCAIDHGNVSSDREPGCWKDSVLGTDQSRGMQPAGPVTVDKSQDLLCFHKMRCSDMRCQMRSSQNGLQIDPGGPSRE